MKREDRPSGRESAFFILSKTNRKYPFLVMTAPSPPGSCTVLESGWGAGSARERWFLALSVLER